MVITAKYREKKIHIHSYLRLVALPAQTVGCSNTLKSLGFLLSLLDYTLLLVFQEAFLVLLTDSI